VIETLVGFAAFFALALLRVPMAFCMGIVGFFGVAYMISFNAAAAMIAQTTFETGQSYTLSVIPLFILMGNFVVRAKLSDELYHAAYCFLGHKRGGLAMSTIIACAGLRRDLWLFHRHRRDLHQGLVSLDAEIWLQGCALGRFDRRRR